MKNNDIKHILLWILILILFGIGRSQAQEIKLYLPVVSYDKETNIRFFTGVGLMFVGGVADGVNQTIRHHPAAFMRKHSDANFDWWLGWKPKKTWWQITLGVINDDGHHFTRFVDHNCTWNGMALIGTTIPLHKGNKIAVIHYLWNMAISIIANKIGFELTHEFYYGRWNP